MKSAKEILTDQKKFHITLGLERIEKILSVLNNPQNNYEVIHIAGTNGKGSTSKIINDILIEHFKDKNISTGLYTSPHLFSYTERIKVDNNDISENIFNSLINQLNNLAYKNNIDLSEFELITAAAFYYFYIKKVKYVILETGLGGLYDATNVIQKPLCSIITTIDFDHTQRLGSTIDDIAVQKAGIIKQNCPVIVSKDNLGYEIIKKIANEKNAKLIEAENVEIKQENNENYAIINNKKYKFNLLGKHQKDNLALALKSIKSFDIKDETIKTALKKVNWKFRLEYHKEKNILIDGSHNPSGIKCLRTFLDDNFKNEKKIIIFGCLNNKDYKTMLKTLIKDDENFYFYEFDYPNALKFENIKDEFNIKKINSIEEIKELMKKEGLKVFCGSLYMLGKIFSQIKL